MLAPGNELIIRLPAMASCNDGSLYATFGVMGGFMQRKEVQVACAMLDDGLDTAAL